MVLKRTAAVTGAFSYTGSYIARALLKRGWEVITLTRDLERSHPLHTRVKAYPLDFSRPEELQANLRGAHTLVNTYWVRFNYPGSSFEQAVQNSRTLIAAAERAGVKRVIHISVSNPIILSLRGAAAQQLQSLSRVSRSAATRESNPQDRALPYYAGKAQVEEIIKASRMSYAILQPTLIFGNEEVLVHNIAWLLRHSPLFTIPGDGSYKLQPIFVEDLAEMTANAASATQNQVLPTAGPEIYTFNELVSLLKAATGSRALVLHAPPWVALLAAKLVGLLLGDVTLTREELQGLMQERLYIGEPALGATRFSQWVSQNKAALGKEYRSELKRHHHKI